MFVTLKDLELIKKIGPRSLKNICKQLAMEDNSPSKELIKNEDTLRQFITPELTPSFIESISTVTSMEVCIDSVCYLTMSRDMHVVEWNHINLQGSNQQKQVPSQILDQAYHVLDHLPKSSIVLMENRITRKITPLYLQYIFFIGRLQMALQTLINEDLRTSGQHKVFHIKDSFLIKTFDLRVGSERVSGQNIMRDVQNDQSSQNVSVASKFWHRYNRLESDILRERYASCFLLSLAFCQNIFLNKPVGKQINSLREIENRQLSDLAEST
uniref:Transcription elongation factor, mitochondrial n=2 Tax=Arion vulgaris TaxID=1028688 RepID=A0A0B6Y0D0_9EUPU